jgi:hypothetical protein
VNGEGIVRSLVLRYPCCVVQHSVQALEQERRNVMAGNGKKDKGNKEKKKKPKLNIKEKRKQKNEKKK